MKWKIEPMLTKNVSKFCMYTKDEHSFVHATYYRWGEAIIYGETKPVFVEYNEDVGLNITAFDEYELHDCYYSCIIDMSDKFPEHLKKYLQNKRFVEDYEICEMEDEGWCYHKHDIMFYGTLQIEEQKKKHCRDA
jgi:hypothetical protein